MISATEVILFIVFTHLSEREFQKVMQTFMQLEGLNSFDHTEVRYSRKRPSIGSAASIVALPSMR